MNPIPPLTGSPHEIAAALRQELERLERRRLPAGSAVASGCAALDKLLPGGGFARGTLVEWLAEDEASGTGTLALLAARQAAVAGGAVVVFDPAERHGGRFYPPAAAALGLDLARLIVVRAAGERDELWALYQTLRSPGVAAVWASREQLEWRWFRRLQLAAEAGGSVGHLLRPASVRGQPTWSQLQLLVEPQPGGGTAGRRLRVELVRCRTATGGGAKGGVVELVIEDVTACPPEASSPDETHPFTLAAELARPGKRRSNKRSA